MGGEGWARRAGAAVMGLALGLEVGLALAVTRHPARPLPGVAIAGTGLYELSGRLVNLDGRRELIFVSAAGRLVPIRVNAETTVLWQGHLGTALDLRAGQWVHAVFNGADRTAVWVEEPSAGEERASK